MKWLITREAVDGFADRALLEKHGIEACLVPCVEFRDLPWPRWASEPGDSVTFLTSKRAARRFIESNESVGLVAALAPSTTRLLADHRRSFEFSATGGAVSLAQALVQAWHERNEPTWHVRYPTSTLGLDMPEQANALEVLSAIGAVERIAVYETRVPTQLTEALAEVTTERWAATFASPSAVSAFLGNVPALASEPEHVLCFGRSTLTQWNELKPAHWRDALLTQNFTETIRSLEDN